MEWPTLFSCYLGSANSNSAFHNVAVSHYPLIYFYDIVKKILKSIISLNPIQDGFFRGSSRIGGKGGKKHPLHKICRTYHTMMKPGIVMPYPKKVQKNLGITSHTPWLLLTSVFFHRKSANFTISRNTDIDCLLTFL